MAKQLSLSLDAKQQETLRKIAEEELTSVSTLVRWAIRDFLKAREEKKGEK